MVIEHISKGCNFNGSAPKVRCGILSHLFVAHFKYNAGFFLEAIGEAGLLARQAGFGVSTACVPRILFPKVGLQKQATLYFHNKETLNKSYIVIPAKAGIQYFNRLDTGPRIAVRGRLCRCDDLFSASIKSIKKT